MVRDEIGEELAQWGKVAILATRGRHTGSVARTAVGFVEEADGSLLLAAGSDEADWALNLRAEPACLVEIGEATGPYTALELQGAERNLAVTGLILKYGTPAERLGSGPAFRLRPIKAGAVAAADASISDDQSPSSRRGMAKP